MSTPEQAAAAQLRNIEQATGRSVADWAAAASAAGLERHGEILAWLKAEHGLTHGNANGLALAVRAAAAGGPASPDALLDAQYAKGKAALRPICDLVVATARGLGDDVSVVVQKSAVSLRRGRQFALVEAPSAARVRLGFNLKGAEPAGRVVATTGMCTHSVDLTGPANVDDEVRAWLTRAYDARA
ncbi:DUF4287 domain-containing protein [Pengzhenrongella sicca]|uniref:DUF4287 domain-containing protein n=1 Tax=Pengzhenrongella sicca TaxID=2819238 RepID=A0A8A4Z9S4_9MICO|nr:DUF4287 domain-containing protein [Pengzhenrongella sicca]QTE27789.1 DUF4287 domain-containing protein [Pengzhenrongella sicca]